MQKQKQIQNLNIFPDTNYFLYKNKQYPIKFDFFKHSSKYFQNNQTELENNKFIPLLDSEQENDIKLTDEIIQDFINFIQGQKVSLTIENVVSLNYLSKKYEVQTLQEISDEFIKDHHQDLIIEILLSQQHSSNLDINNYENILSDHLSEYINNDHLSDLNISIINNILHKHQNQHQNQKGEIENKIEEETIINFLFKCLDKHGKEASPLFSNINFSNFGTKYLNKLINEYSTVFDFHFINSSIIEIMYNEEKTLLCNIINYEQKQKDNELIIENFEKNISNMMFEMQKLIQTKNEQGKQIKDFQLKEEKHQKEQIEYIDKTEKEILKIKNCINQIELENKKKEEELKIQYEKEMSQLKDEIMQIKTELNIERKRQKQKEDELKDQYEKEIIQLKDEINQLKIEQSSHLNENDESYSLDENPPNNLEDNKNHPKIDLSIFNDTKIDLKLFNNMEGENQKSFFNNSKFDNSKFNEIKSLLSFLSNEFCKSTKEKPKFNFIFFQKAFANTHNSDEGENNNDDLMIGISYNMIELLYENGNLDSKKFSDQIGNFSRIVVEVSYPSPNFDSIYQIIINLKKSHSRRLKIKIFITGIESINQKFYRDKNANFIQIDSSVKKILSNGEKGSFRGCSSLKEIVIPPSVSEMGNDAFRGCESLVKIEIPPSVRSISYNSFIGCTKLKQIILPSTLKYIGSYAFQKCESLEQIIIPPSLKSIKKYSFSQCKSLSKISIPSTVEIIEMNAFWECSSINEVLFENNSSLKSIESYAFDKCSSLKQIIIPSTVESIGKLAFNGCPIEKIEIPSAINSSNIGLSLNVKIIKK